MTGFRAEDAGAMESEGNGRRGREVGNECVRPGAGRGCAEAASGDDTRGRDATGLNGEGAGTVTVMTAVVVGVRDASEKRRVDCAQSEETYSWWICGCGKSRREAKSFGGTVRGADGRGGSCGREGAEGMRASERG